VSIVRLTEHTSVEANAGAAARNGAMAARPFTLSTFMFNLDARTPIGRDARKQEINGGLEDSYFRYLGSRKQLQLRSTMQTQGIYVD
jgi:hypothetical protein